MEEPTRSRDREEGGILTAGRYGKVGSRQQSLRVLFKYEGTFTREFHDVGVGRISR